MSKGVLLCKDFCNLCFWLLWNVTHCYRSCLRRLWLQVYRILQAHELFPWGPHCILDLHGVLWPASTIQFLSSWHPVLENDLLVSLSISKLLLKKCLLFRKTHRGVWQEKTAFGSRNFQWCIYTHADSHLRKSGDVYVPVFEMIKNTEKFQICTVWNRCRGAQRHTKGNT